MYKPEAGRLIPVLKEEIEGIKEDIKKLTFIILRELFNDFSVFNRFPELKRHLKGIMIHGAWYNREYYRDLNAEIRSDFIKGLCLIYSIPHTEFKNQCRTMTTSFAVGAIKFQAMYLRRRINAERPNRVIQKKLKKLSKKT